MGTRVHRFQLIVVFTVTLQQQKQTSNSDCTSVGSDWSFIRFPIIQNSADAKKCRLYKDPRRWSVYRQKSTSRVWHGTKYQLLVLKNYVWYGHTSFSVYHKLIHKNYSSKQIFMILLIVEEVKLPLFRSSLNRKVRELNI